MNKLGLEDLAFSQVYDGSKLETGMRLYEIEKKMGTQLELTKKGKEALSDGDEEQSFLK